MKYGFILIILECFLLCCSCSSRRSVTSVSEADSVAVSKNEEFHKVIAEREINTVDSLGVVETAGFIDVRIERDSVGLPSRVKVLRRNLVVGGSRRTVSASVSEMVDSVRNIKESEVAFTEDTIEEPVRSKSSWRVFLVCCVGAFFVIWLGINSRK